MSWLDAYFGRIFANGSELERRGGLNFGSGFTATPNAVADRIDLTAQQGPTGPTAGGASYTTNTIPSEEHIECSFTMNAPESVSFWFGQFVRATAIGFPEAYLEGYATGWTGGVITIDAINWSGTGEYSAWNVFASGEPGAAGADGSPSVSFAEYWGQAASTLAHIVGPPGSRLIGDTAYVGLGGRQDTFQSLATNASTELLPVDLDIYQDVWWSYGHTYSATLRATVSMYKASDSTKVGTIDVIVDVHIDVQEPGELMEWIVVTQQTAPQVDSTRVNTALTGATATITAATNGFSVFATRPADVSCYAKVSSWVLENLELLT